MKQITKVINRHFQFDKGNNIMGVVFLVTICLTVWGINLYRVTIISTSYLFIVSAFGGVIGLVLIPKILKWSYSKIWKVFLKLVIGAGIFYFGFLYLNQAFPGKEIMSNDFQIVKTGTLARGKFGSCHQPYAIINFNGTEKQLVFYCDFENTIKNYSKVSVTYSTGLFGFYIIKLKKLML